VCEFTKWACGDAEWVCEFTEWACEFSKMVTRILNNALSDRLRPTLDKGPGSNFLGTNLD